MGIPYLAAGASSDLNREKTAPASESLAHNLANAANGEETVHAVIMRRTKVRRQELGGADLSQGSCHGVMNCSLTLRGY